MARPPISSNRSGRQLGSFGGNDRWDGKTKKREIGEIGEIGVFAFLESGDEMGGGGFLLLTYRRLAEGAGEVQGEVFSSPIFASKARALVRTSALEDWAIWRMRDFDWPVCALKPPSISKARSGT